MHRSIFALLIAVAVTASSLRAAEPIRIEECMTESDIILVAAHVGPILDSGLIAGSIDTAPAWMQSLVTHNVETVYLTLDLLNATPAIFIPIPDGADAAAVSQLQDAGRELGNLLEVASDRGDPLGSFAFVGTADKRARILNGPAIEKAGLAAALEASSDSRISIILAWTPDQQRVLREIFPTLPTELGNIDGEIMADQVMSVRLSIPRDADAIQLEVIADDAETAEQMGDAFEGWLNYAVANSGNEMAANMMLGMFDFSRETDGETCRLTWTSKLPVDQVRPLMQEWFASSTSEVDTANNLKQIGLALHNFHDNYGSFPPSASYVDGRPLLSWRVYVLPYIDAALYQQFHLNEAWDSPHNMGLLSQMPDVYGSADPELNSQGLTRFVVPVAEETIFHGETGIKFQDITDGTSNTALVVTVPAEHAVPWTKPSDWEVDFTANLHAWLFAEQDGVSILSADGSVHRLDATLTAENLRRLLQHQDGEPVEW